MCKQFKFVNRDGGMERGNREWSEDASKHDVCCQGGVWASLGSAGWKILGKWSRFFALTPCPSWPPYHHHQDDYHHVMRHHDRRSDIQHHDHDNDDQHILHFQTFTGGKRCLLLHGWLDNAGTWDKVAVLIKLISLLGLIINLINFILAGLAFMDITVKVT